MISLSRTHRYLSILVAPAMIFFAVSGAWQAFRLQQSRKDGSYRAPAVLTRLSDAHMAERLTPERAVWARVGQVLLAALFSTTALAGIAMALRLTRPVWRVWLLLAVGAVIPFVLAIATHR